ncbi:Xin actin-binding repeat-containing protein 2 [Liparis tanakae]|uniref:Xin actin-binding repeat-containing protein 2 n=1 Tax=Liparis tanakae TaxID=230148 RepID=A0A4Z2HFY2_9TELE|nr:Xin actin-binding repeat-containing protein 2 [Liparis tanakae]
MVQNRTDSSTDNVTSSVQSGMHKPNQDPAAERCCLPTGSTGNTGGTHRTGPSSSQASLTSSTRGSATDTVDRPCFVAEMSNSEVTMSSSSRQVVSSSQQQHVNQEATIGRDITQAKWSSNVTQNNTVTNKVFEASAEEAAEDTLAEVMDYEDFPPPPDEDFDFLPPPPPDLLEMPSESENMPACYYSPEPPEPAHPSKYPLNKEAYCKQRSMYELKRLYKHIHPEVRKNIEKEYYNDCTETENNHSENQEYMYEDDGGSPDDINDDELTEWEEILPGEVQAMRWMFENKPLDSIKDETPDEEDDDNKITEQEMIVGKDLLTKEDIIAGNVRSARQYFETVPGEELKDLAEVGKLKRTVTLDEEKGDVRHQKWRFESQPLEQIRQEKKEVTRTIDLEEIDRVDVSNYKHRFESTDLNWSDESQKILIEGVTSGYVKANTNLFESTSLYAMLDSSGHFHEVKTVRREEVVKGDVTSYKWMFETRPIDQFDESIDKYQIIKGISKEEIESGDVKTAKWLFETQPLDAIKYFSNIEDEEVVGTETNVEHMKGDVKTCKWLFETKPMDRLCERAELKGEKESEEMHKGDVKTSTWLFETQALDSIHDETETILKTCTVNQEDIRGKDVRTACFLFETDKLENLSGEESGSFKRVIEIDIASGDVSGMKYIFENQTSDIMTSTSEEMKFRRRTKS